MKVRTHFLLSFPIILTFSILLTKDWIICMCFGMIGATLLDIDHVFMYMFSFPRRFFREMFSIKKIIFNVSHLFFGYDEDASNFLIYFIYHSLFGVILWKITDISFSSYSLIIGIGVSLHLMLDIVNVRVKTESKDTPVKRDWGVLLILCVIALFGYCNLRDIKLADTCDFRFYMNQLEHFRSTGHLITNDLPIAYIFLYISSCFFNDYYTSFSFILSFLTSISCFIIYAVNKKITGSTLFSILSSVLIFNAQTYELILLVIVKNLIGNFFLLLSFLSFVFYLNSKSKKWGIMLFFFSVISTLTHSICTFSIMLVLFFFCVFSYIQRKDIRWDILLIILVLSILLLSFILSIGNQYEIFLETFTFEYSFPLFYESLNSFPLTVSILIFVGIIITCVIKRRKNEIDTFVLCLALMGLIFHLLSFMTPYYWGIRMQDQTYMFYIFCLPYLTYKEKKENYWLIVFVVACYVLPFISRFIGG